MGRKKETAQSLSRPKRRATNVYVLRYLQTRNPSRLEENDLKRALEQSLEEYPDFWPEDSSSSNSNVDSISSGGRQVQSKRRNRSSSSSASSTSSQQNHLCNNPNHSLVASLTANSNCCPINHTVHNRYKPVARKNIYHEADFFHDGIMEYIEYELRRTAKNR